MAAKRWSVAPRHCSHSYFIFVNASKTNEILTFLWSKSRFPYRNQWNINILALRMLALVALLLGWLSGCLAAWLPGCLAAWLPGCLAAWLPGWLAAWRPGCLAAWVPGCLAAWLPGWLPGWLYVNGCPEDNGPTHQTSPFAFKHSQIRNSQTMKR